jgi:hypothetical protein
MKGSNRKALAVCRRRIPALLPAALLVGLLGFTPAWAVDAETCSGDCNGDDVVTVNELLLAVNIATMDSVPIALCPSADANGDGSVTIDEIVVAVDHALNGCTAGGKDVYAGLDDDAIAVFQRDAATGTLVFVEAVR